MSYRNYEGYSDPTAGTALGNIRREERRRRRRRIQEEKETNDWLPASGEHHHPGGDSENEKAFRYRNIHENSAVC